MAEQQIHAFVTSEPEPYGYTLTSPNIPGLVYGADSETTFMAELKDVLRWAGFTEGQVIGHSQRRGTTSTGTEFVTRFQTGVGSEDRVRTASAVLQLLESDDEKALRMVRELTPAPTGELVFVACMPSDTLGWLLDQLRPEGDVLTATMLVADMMVASTQVASEHSLDWPTVDDLGWTRETTIGQLFTKRESDRPVLLRAS